MADIWMDVDTALAEVPVNLMPLIDDTDFKAIEASVAYNATGLVLVWNFVTTAGAQTQTAVTPTTAGVYDWTSQGNGLYAIEIPASGGASINNDTEGFGWFTGVATGVLPWRGPVIGFRAAALNNSNVDGATIDVNVTTMATDSLTAAALKADAVTEIQNGLATPSNITAGTITTVTNLTNLPAITTNWLTAAGIAADAVTELQAGLALEATLTAIKGVGWTTETLAAIDVLIDAIKAKTDNLPASPAGASDVSVAIASITPSLAVSSVEALLASTGEMALSVRYTMRETVSSTITDNLSAATKLWFVIKETGETDANSLVFCEKTAGLTIVNKVAYATAAHGTLTVTGSAGDWEIAVTIDEAATTNLSAWVNNYYDASVKALIGGHAVHVWDGRCRIVLGVIEAIA